MKKLIFDLEKTFLQKFTELNEKLMNPVKDQISEPMVVFDFVFPDGQKKPLEGYNRGIGPLGLYLEPWEVPVGVYTDDGDYFGIIFDDRKTKMSSKATFRIGDKNYYNKILHCYENFDKVDPKTGILIVQEA